MLYDLRWLIPQRGRAAIRRFLDRDRSTAASRLGPRLYETLEGKVASGPFAGMKYLSSAAGSELCPKLLGTYEMELAPAVAEAINKSYDLIVDAGAAEGYWAVGLAIKFPAARVVAFEMGERGQKLLAEMAALNGVSQRLEIRGQCTAVELNEVLKSCRRALFVCDVEGAEVDLLDLQTCPNLQKADILVEVHNGRRPAAGRRIRGRFASRRITVFSKRKRTLADFPAGVAMEEADKLAAMWENRSFRQDWFWMPATI